MQDTKKKLATEDCKKKERHIVSWTQQVYTSFPSLILVFVLNTLFPLFILPSAVISDMGFWNFRRMIFFESRLTNMEQKSMTSQSLTLCLSSLLLI